jgi:hypothetical protein
MRTAWWAIAVVVLLLAALQGHQLWQQQQRLAHQAEFLAAQQRWQAAGITAYTMRATENQCPYTSVVQAGIGLIDGLQINCTFQPATVEGMFDLIALDGRSDLLCDQNGCPCESVTSAWGRYDPLLGFPMRVELVVDLHPTWWRGDFWRHLLREGGLPPCQTRNLTLIDQVVITPDR